MNKKKVLLNMAAVSLCILLAAIFLAVYLFQKNIVTEAGVQLAKSLTEQISRDVSIGDLRRAHETLINKTFGNFEVVDFDIIENNHRILKPTSTFKCNKVEYSSLKFCTKDLNNKEYYFKFLKPGIYNIFSTTEFKLLFLLITAVSFIYNALLVAIFNSQLNNFITFFNKIIKRNKLTEEDLISFEDFKDKFILLETQLKEHDQEIENKVKTQAQLDLAKQLAHDIRSPLAALNSLLEDEQNLNPKILKNSILRINDISNKLLKQTQHDLIKLPSYNKVSPIIQEIIEEKLIENSNKKIIINFVPTKLDEAFFEPSEFKRIISNLLNNSIEASEDPIIHINPSRETGNIIIRISDNGKGIPDIIVDNIGKKSITTKKHGNGLGLSHAYTQLKEWEGYMEIESTGACGTILKLTLKENNVHAEPAMLNKKNIILIDDDELTRMTWEMKAKKTDIELKTFKDIQTFKAIMDAIDKDTEIYIDSELGDIKGEALAIELNNIGFRNLSIASGHPPERFAEYTFLRSVISKKAPF